MNPAGRKTLPAYAWLILLLLLSPPSCTPKKEAAPASSPLHFVFVPFPCPSAESYNKAIAYVDAACEVAQKENMKVTIVRAPYNMQDYLKQSEQGNWWWTEISALPERYDKYIKDGTVELVDTTPLKLEYTPCGYLFVDGKVMWKEVLPGAQSPQSLVNSYKK